jgi:hypothetical protein
MDDSDVPEVALERPHKLARDIRGATGDLGTVRKSMFLRGSDGGDGVEKCDVSRFDLLWDVVPKREGADPTGEERSDPKLVVERRNSRVPLEDGVDERRTTPLVSNDQVTLASHDRVRAVEQHMSGRIGRTHGR